MLNENYIFYIFATITGTISGSILIFLSTRYSLKVYRGKKIIYTGTAILEFCFGLIYILTMIKVIPGEFGPYIRPLLPLLFLTPALVALVHRKE